MRKITAGDFLAGGGGVTEAMSQIPEMDVRWVLNHDKEAIRTNQHHHKDVLHYWADLYQQDEHEMEPVDFVWASIECTQHSSANGGRTKKVGSYMLGWELFRYIDHLKPLVIGIENVPEFKKWAPLETDGSIDKKKKGLEFERWKECICALGYDYEERIYNAADFGIPTRRVRYFAFFVSKALNMSIPWIEPTHSKTGEDGLKKWIPCKDYLDLNNEGNSIFGREFNENVAKGKRHPLSVNTMKRIAGGIKKYAPEMQWIFQYYGSGLNAQDINKPLHTVTTKDRHVLVSLEKLQFIQEHCHSPKYDKPDEAARTILGRETKEIVSVDATFVQDHCHTDNFHKPDDPMNPILTWESKQIVSAKLMLQHYSGLHSSNVNEPLPTITTVDHNALVTAKAQFVSPQYNSNGNPGANATNIDGPIGTLTTKEKMQFITAYFNSSGNPGSQNHSADAPLGTILTGTNKQALVTAIKEGKLDFDIKMRFVTPEELSQISTFPKGYFTDPELKLTKKYQVRLIGNAVPVEWARQIIRPVVQAVQKELSKSIAV